MTPAGSLRIVTGLALVLATSAAGAGLFWLPAEQVPLKPDLFGAGLYRRDTAFVAGASQGADLFSLFFVTPVAIWFAMSRLSTRLSLVVLATAHAWWLYLGFSLALGAVAFNELFPVYVGLIPVSIVGLALTLNRIGQVGTPRFLAAFLCVSGVVTIGTWTFLLWVELATNQFPPTTYYTVRTTYAIDLGLIAPGCFAASIAVWKRWLSWPILAIPLLGLEATLLPMMVLQTLMQVKVGVVFGLEAAAPLLGFGLISIVAFWFLGLIARQAPLDAG